MALYNHKGEQVHVPAGKQLSDYALKQLVEKHEPATHKGHKFFRIEERAHIKS